jgi:type I restriction enzyme, R subunit
MSLHKEISFEDEICGHLAAHEWLYSQNDAALYDRARALFPPDLVGWMQATQSPAWQTLTKNHGASAESILLARIRKQLDDRGTLDVLRHGVELIGLRQPIMLAQFKPALAMNADILARYAANRLRVVRTRTASTLYCSSTGCRSPQPNSRPTSLRASTTPSTSIASTATLDRRGKELSRC